MAEFAKRLALRTDTNRTCCSYYRNVRLIHEHCACDPELITQDQFRDYILHVKTVKGWRPRTIRQTVASASLFFVDQLGHHDWTVFSQIKTKDHDDLPCPEFGWSPRRSMLLGAECLAALAQWLETDEKLA